ncbi:integrase [Pseudonocardia parietis]|uniref:Site-specific recombinase XerD n=1 Tax=Pseudonocardia parietis TaxID=570936 RepID=A0ABS4W0X8_9PSEU|nr:integrase [Pseudonocardia parietis]MBP2369860.1 site-specific recombinase XerD [Pseudonocardia parietis]
MPLKNRYCRLCWLQAALQAQDPPIVTPADLAAVTSHQLSFAGTTKMRGPRSGARRRLHTPPAADRARPAGSADGGQLQLHLPGPGRAFDRAQHAELDNHALIRVRRIAATMSQAHGWNAALVAELDRALVVVLSGHADGERLRYSQLIEVLHRYGVSISRVAEVLSQAGLLDDDRVPAFESWLAAKLADLAPGIIDDVRAWVRALQRGGPRNHPRDLHTVRRYLRAAHPVLVDWSTRYQHLREVTTSDVTGIARALRGHPRRRTLGALRSLMRYCKKTGSIFADPTARVRIGHRDESIILPLTPAQIDDVTQAATTPAARLTLALAAVHAARPESIRTLHLDDVDLGNRRLTIAAVTRPLDELTHRLLLDWLAARRSRWPNTANPHLIINKQTASTTRPVSVNALTAPFRGRAATLENLRVDRQLEEALTHGADPLHLATVFGLDETTAIRYSDAAAKLLHTPADHHPGSARTQGSNRS